MRILEKLTLTFAVGGAASALCAGITDGTKMEVAFGTAFLVFIGCFLAGATVLIWKS